LEAGLSAVDPERLTADALTPHAGESAVVIAIGKAAPAMARGASSVLDIVGGVCVSDHIEPTSDRLRFLVGDHPVPGAASLQAAEAVLEAVQDAPPAIPIIALISGGGSALCEKPRDGVPGEYLAEVTRRLIAGGAGIEEMNLVRAHLSAIKGGGVSRAAGRPIDTYVISDVAGADPGVVASGPTIPRAADAEAATLIMRRAAIDVPEVVLAVLRTPQPAIAAPEVTLLANGLDAARGVASAVSGPVEVRSDWLAGPVEPCIERFFAGSGPGVTVGAGETVLEVTGEGRGGRNTHAALLAATRIAGTYDVFVAFATDGVDGASGSAGAVVDGGTMSRGGDPSGALDSFDSAGYLETSSDLLRCSPTGTNVSDIWILWRREPVAT
jgi:hydroxypyruvate reductase